MMRPELLAFGAPVEGAARLARKLRQDP
jgi:hypothetical protein